MVSYKDIEEAHERLKGHAERTPVLTSTTVDSMTGAKIFFKCENFQRAGAFKFRGAYNAASRLDAGQLARGIGAYSSGNHAQAVALAARLLGTTAVILMPEDTPAGKLAATRAYGAEVVTYDRYTGDREALGAVLADERGLTLIPPYEHPHVMAAFPEIGDLARQLGQGLGAAQLHADGDAGMAGAGEIAHRLGEEPRRQIVHVIVGAVLEHVERHALARAGEAGDQYQLHSAS